MNNIEIKHIDETRRLKLSGVQFFWYYLLGFLPLFLSFSSFWKYIKIKSYVNYNGVRTANEMLVVAIVWFLLAILVVIVKYRRLNFKFIPVALNKREFQEKMRHIARKEKWKLSLQNENCAIYSNGSHFTWGLKMTVLRFDEYLLVNSICDLEAMECISIFNENDRNIKRFEKAISNSLGPFKKKGL